MYNKISMGLVYYCFIGILDSYRYQNVCIIFSFFLSVGILTDEKSVAIEWTKYFH